MGLMSGYYKSIAGRPGKIPAMPPMRRRLKFKYDFARKKLRNNIDLAIARRRLSQGFAKIKTATRMKAGMGYLICFR